MFLWKQRSALGGIAVLSLAESENSEKYFSFRVTGTTAEQHLEAESLALSLTRLTDFLVESGVKELSLPVYEPNRGRLHPWEIVRAAKCNFVNHQPRRVLT